VPDLNPDEWDGALEVQLESEEKILEWINHPYMADVIQVDELEFLVSLAADHSRAVPVGTITGDRNVLIENGKPLINYDAGVKAWKEWQTRKGM
jgi:hypothetical protein